MRVSREDPLLRVGVHMMALAVALVIIAAVVSVALRSEPGRVVASEVATKSPGEPPRYSSGEEGSATKKSSSSEKEPPPRYPSGEEESLGYGSSSTSGGPVFQREEEAKEEPQAVGKQDAEPPKSQSAMPQAAGQQTPSEAPSEPEPQPQPDQQFLPGAEANYWPEPTQEEIQSANNPRHYGLLPGAIMSLTIEGIGIHDAPVFDSDGYNALLNGIAHVPGTSWPWSSTPQRNVYLAGHRMGYRGTWSRMLFYNLDELSEGDRIVLRDRAGRTYEYRVSEVLLADPADAWVMGQVRGRDMVSLQTCTPVPTFEKRLIVRANRV